MKLTRPSLKDQALAVIRQGMVSGEIRPGEIHSAAGMAARLGTSNGPVREAMLTLVEQGIMQVVPNVGFQVTRLTDEDLDEIHELRLMLEVPAMRRLGEEGIAGREEDVRRHAEESAAAAAARDVARFLSADREFHLSLLELLGNGRLVKFVANLRDQTRLYGLHNLAEEGQLESSAAEHAELLEALVAGDGERAARVMGTHLGHVRGDWASPLPGAGPASATG
ncbi:GntR family transcriptional regulator [Georgenia daeguensis]|uniref:GntR family transcriptional regulator n=1 Tax=Georgenia daeguensis TaxID=908355 RepID=A0ABP8EU43_9MICO